MTPLQSWILLGSIFTIIVWGRWEVRRYERHKARLRRMEEFDRQARAKKDWEW